ncbi:sensor domain-containing diguanylate cyclase [Priestia abyssalis]|uniref:sensor domain-containing diguanylate cyclase n=1 Tax=Priestia abyssalis TaxID=1221450 RepID=UPI000994B132|nr:sensor domain-containing diguanylate cyclase [Priestia abyssalis]
MISAEKHQLQQIKTEFFNLLTSNDTDFPSKKIVYEMVHAIYGICDVKETAFILKDSNREQAKIIASCCAEEEMPTEPSHILSLVALFEEIMFSIHKNVQQYEDSFLIPLIIHRKTKGYLYIKTNKADVRTADFFSLLGDECVRLLNFVYNYEQTFIQEKRYEQLYRVTTKFHSSMDMNDVLVEVIQTLKEVYPTFDYYLLLSHDYGSHEHLPIKYLQYDGDNVSMKAMESYVTGTVQTEKKSDERRFVLYAPLNGKQGIYGILQVIAPDTAVLPEEEVKFISLLANTAGSALENAQLYHQSRKLIEDLKLINETSHRLNSSLRLADTISFMSKQICKSFRAREVGFVLFTDEMNFKTFTGSTAFFFTAAVQKYIAFVYEKMVKEKDSLFINEASAYLDEALSQFRSIMAVPMMQGGEVKGATIVLHEEPYFFSFDNFKLLQSLIHHSTLAFTNSMLREELEKLVVTDYLTKLYSRNYLDEQIRESMDKDGFGTFLLIDIDNFKKVNDTYGHQVGDQIIIQIAHIIKKHIRENDIGARWGGEELAVYLPSVPLKIGVQIAKRLVQKVEDYTNPKTTISCGVSFWTRDVDDSVQRLFNRADEALYKAKHSGKNQVVVQDENVFEST